MSDDVSLLGPADVRRLAAELELRPSKRHGQNFVIDANTVRRIAALAAVEPDEHVLEVGPGLGSLTLALLGARARVTAVEVDARLAAALPATVAARATPERAAALTVVQADALSVRLDTVPTALVANLPYNVAVPVLLHAWEAFPSLLRAVVMVQLEVAERLTAGPGSRVYGVPSVKLAWFCRAVTAGRVGRQVFWPAPRVDSALVAMTRRPAPETTTGRAAVFGVVDTAFGQRRKMLRSSLAALVRASGSPDPFASARVEPTARAEDLGVEDFARLTDALRAP